MTDKEFFEALKTLVAEKYNVELSYNSPEQAASKKLTKNI